MKIEYYFNIIQMNKNNNKKWTNQKVLLILQEIELSK